MDPNDPSATYRAPDIAGAPPRGRAASTDPGGAAAEEVYAGTPPDPQQSAADAMAELGKRFGELKEYAGYFVAAKLDGVKITVRNIGVYAVLGILALIAGSAVVTTAVVLLLVGLAFAIGAIFEYDKPWFGAIVVGLLVLGGLAAGVIFGMRWLTNTSRKALVQKYENRQRDQRINFGRDVRGRVAHPATEVSGS